MMDNLNNIPNVGNWGDASAKLNDNFMKIKNAVTSVENVSKNNKGYFPSLTALNTAYPTPGEGLVAYVADELSSTGYYVATVVSGEWELTATEAPSVGVDLADYAKTGGSEKTVKDVEDEIVQLAGNDIKGWILGEAYDISNITYHVDGNISTADLKFPDQILGKITETTVTEGLITSMKFSYNEVLFFELIITYNGDSVSTELITI